MFNNFTMAAPNSSNSAIDIWGVGDTRNHFLPPGLSSLFKNVNDLYNRGLQHINSEENLRIHTEKCFLVSFTSLKNLQFTLHKQDEIKEIEEKRIKAERIEASRIEASRIEASRIEAERIEASRIKAAHIDAERIKAARIEAERIEAERIEVASSFLNPIAIPFMPSGYTSVPTRPQRVLRNFF